MCIDADTGGIFSDKELSPELMKWNKRNRVMKSDERNHWYEYSHKIFVLIKKRNIISKKKRRATSSREEHRGEKKSKVEEPISMNVEKIEQIEQRMEIVGILLNM